MRRVLVGFFAVIGILAVLSLIAVGVAAFRLQPSKPKLADNIILSADLTQTLADGRGEEGWRQIVIGNRPNLRDFLDALEVAGSDPRVKGILARLGGDGMGLARVQQVRDAIAAFRAKGKFAIGFA